ncbi:MAG TPA: CbtA family protein [Nocardioides sp.]|nr:CbtA family protein [Nocardioides sp.]
MGTSALSPGAFLVRGLLVGLAAGLVAFAVAFLVGEPHVERAIELEEAAASAPHQHAHGEDAHQDAHTHDGDEVVVTRGTQRTWGLLTGNVAIGVALGGIVGLVAAVALGRIGRLAPRQSTLTVCAVGFVAVALLPYLKYPPNPPGVGSADTIDSRTASYFGFLLVSVLVAVLAVHLATRVWPTHGGYVATLAGVATYLLVVVVAALLLPGVDEAGDFPADTLWSFRVASLLTLAALWGTIGVGLTGLVGRLHDRAQADVERRAFAASL